MGEYIAFDSHKQYTLAEREDMVTGRVRQYRIEHVPGAIREFLKRCPKGSKVAEEATGNWYWIVQEIEEAGFIPRLVHPRKAKLMMGMINKTDKLDVHGLNRLQRAGTLPEVWIAPGKLRDRRELTRTRMVLCGQRTQLKNRILATLAKYGLKTTGADAFGLGGLREMATLLSRMPEQTRWTTELVLEQVDGLTRRIKALEVRLEELVQETPQMALLRTLPGVGRILSAVLALEIGEVSRFASGEKLASYAGTTPRVKSSGGKTQYGKLRSDVNRYLKWAYVEAANVVALHHRKHPDRHVSRLYARIRLKRGHAKAVGAVARHLAEASWQVMTKETAYLERGLGSCKGGVSA